MGDDELRPTLPPETPEVLAGVAAACFDPDPANRPSFALIVHHMRKVGAPMIRGARQLRAVPPAKRTFRHVSMHKPHVLVDIDRVGGHP